MASFDQDQMVSSSPDIFFAILPSPLPNQPLVEHHFFTFSSSLRSQLFCEGHHLFEGLPNCQGLFALVVSLSRNWRGLQFLNGVVGANLINKFRGDSGSTPAYGSGVCTLARLFADADTINGLLIPRAS